MSKHISFCFHCSLNIGKYKCSLCKSVYYCSKECQTKDWKVHKTKCPNIVQNIKKVINECSTNIKNIINDNKESIFSDLKRMKFNPNKSFLYFSIPINVTEDFKNYKKTQLLTLPNLFPDPNVLNYLIVENNSKVMNALSASKELKYVHLYRCIYFFNTVSQKFKKGICCMYIITANSEEFVVMTILTK